MRNDARADDAGRRLLSNPRRREKEAYPQDLDALIGEEQVAQAVATISGWRGYSPTPLLDLDILARRAHVASISYKDEAGRFGLGSFKALGGAYAVHRLMERLGGEAARSSERITVCCATDGNHGRAVAWGAQIHGCDCVIFLHERVSFEREAAISALGARIVRIAGNYDDAVRAAARAANEHGWHVVSDTSYAGYADIPLDVMAGYTMITEELSVQVDRPVTHVFLQAGVGGMAAALAADLWRRLGDRLPRIILVEPVAADCLLRSMISGRPALVSGDLDTIMAGLACGEVSQVAWLILDRCASHAMTIRDDDAAEMMCLLAEGAGACGPIIAGESAVAGLAGLMRVAADGAMRAQIGLDEDSHVLCIGTEGATDPRMYRKITGKAPERVQGAF